LRLPQWEDNDRTKYSEEGMDPNPNPNPKIKRFTKTAQESLLHCSDLT